MKIYGVAILAACYLAGQLLGLYLGKWIGVGGNVGGVGFGMLLLIWANGQFKDTMPSVDKTLDGIYFWSAMYIPVVIAMSATLNVKSAISGGWVAVLAGILATSACYFLIPMIAGMVKVKQEL
jgi:malonate transporter MadL subunit